MKHILIGFIKNFQPISDCFTRASGKYSASVKNCYWTKCVQVNSLPDISDTFWTMSEGRRQTESMNAYIRSGESPKNVIKIIAQMGDHASHVLHRLEYPVGYPITAVILFGILGSYLFLHIWENIS